VWECVCCCCCGWILRNTVLVLALMPVFLGLSPWAYWPRGKYELSTLMPRLPSFDASIRDVECPLDLDCAWCGDLGPLEVRGKGPTALPLVYGSIELLEYPFWFGLSTRGRREFGSLDMGR